MKIVVFDNFGTFTFILKAANGDILMESTKEYTRRRNLLKTIRSIKKQFPASSVVDETGVILEA